VAGLCNRPGQEADDLQRPVYNLSSMRAWLRKCWPLLKALFTIAILVAIGRRFALDLQIPEKGWKQSLEDVWRGLVHPGWLLASGFLYLLGLGFSAFYWYRLLRMMDQDPGRLASVRAYYVGHLGKYLPGKAWAVFLRAGLIRGPRVTYARAVLTTFYEVLVTMAGGTVLAVLLLALLAPDTSAGMDWLTLRKLLSAQEPGGLIDRKVLMALGILLLVPIGIPILPPVYNWIIGRMAGRIRQRYGITGPLPRVRSASMVEGLVLTGCGWIFLGGSLMAVLHAVMLNPPAWTPVSLGRYSAFLALAYVAGFIIFLVPSGLGIREFFLTLFLVPDISQLLNQNEPQARATAVFAVILLRLVWTAAEMVIIPVLYFLPASLLGDTTAGDEPTGALAAAQGGARAQNPGHSGRGPTA